MGRRRPSAAREDALPASPRSCGRRGDVRGRTRTPSTLRSAPVPSPSAENMLRVSSSTSLQGTEDIGTRREFRVPPFRWPPLPLVNQHPIARLIEGPRQFSRRAVGARDLSSFRSERAPELLEGRLHQVARRRRREVEIARCAMRRRGAEPALEHQSRESFGLHAVAGAVVICARGALRDQDPEQDEPRQCQT